MNVAMAALDAVIIVRGSNGERSVKFTDFHLEPGDHPERETVLEPGELITAVELPSLPFASRSRYLKVRDRASYAFAMASAAVALDLQNGKIAQARIALGGVGTKPWRAFEAEKHLVGKTPSQDAFQAAAESALRGAKKYNDNGFKVELAKRTIIRTLTVVSQMA
jgi:xanthine dehydrogenase YagS FAD-binding subunit